jgi:Putative adhesin
MTSFETPGPLALDLSVPSGKIELTASETGTTEVELDPVHDNDAARAMIERATVELRPRGDGHELVVEVPTERGFGIRFGRASDVLLRVRCPEGARVKVRSRSADIVARGTFGRTDVRTFSGDIEWESVDGDGSLHSTSGDVRVESVTGGLEVKTVSGDSEIGTVGGDLKVDAVSGDVQVGGVDGSVSSKTVSGDQRLTVAEGKVALVSVSGDLEARVRSGSRVFVDANAVSGEVSSELELSGTESAGTGPLVEIRARSVSGDIRINRG